MTSIRTKTQAEPYTNGRVPSTQSLNFPTNNSGSKVRISMRVYFFLQGNKNNNGGMKALKGAVKVNISKYYVHRSSYARQYITFFAILI